MEKRRSGLCTVTIPPSKTCTSRTKLQSLRVSLIENNPLAGVLQEREVTIDMSWIITEGTSSVRTDMGEVAEAPAKRTVVVRATILGVAWGTLTAVRALVLQAINTKVPLVVTLKTNSCRNHNKLWASLGS